MKVGLTGGQGFIGKWVTQELLERGHSVLILDHKRRPTSEYCDDPKVDYLWGDVRDDTSMLELAAHVGGIIHLAAVLGTQETIADPRPAAETNVQGGLNFLQAITRYDIPGVNIAVGNFWMLNPYSVSKSTVERFCHMYRKERKTRINQVRAVNAYGPLQAAAPPFSDAQVRKITPAFACRALSKMPIEVYGDGLQVSDMVYVADVASTLVHALEEAAEDHVYDFVIEAGPKESNTVLEVAQMVAEAAQRYTGEVSPIVNLPMRPGEIPGDKVTADTTTLENVGLDPNAFTPLEIGIDLTVDWFWDNRGITWQGPKEALA